MPLYKRKPFVFAQPPTPEELGTDPDNALVYVLRLTNEIFKSYDDYISRYSLYRQPIWQCEVTGKSGLSYEEALVSERQAKNILEDRFPEQLKALTLRMVNFRTDRLEKLVDDAYRTFLARYQPGESVGCQIEGLVYSARLLGPAFSPMMNPMSLSHVVEDLNIPPAHLMYTVQLLDEYGNPAENMTRDVGVECLSRDRLQFSKTIIKKFIREMTIKESYLGAPWVVKPELARRYGIPEFLPEHLRKAKEDRIQNKGKGRKKKYEMIDSDTDSQSSTPRRKMKFEDGKAMQRRKEEQPKAKIKPIRYPIEDLELPAEAMLLPVPVYPKEGEEGEVKMEFPERPEPRRDFEVPREHVENMLMVWGYLVSYGKPLGLSPFTLDDFECAILHNSLIPRCTMIVETISSLLNAVIRDRRKPSASSSAGSATGKRTFSDGYEAMGAWEAAKAFGSGWDSQVVSLAKRKDWAKVLVGCIGELASQTTLPDFDTVIRHLMFPTSSSFGKSGLIADPENGYWELPVGEKLAVLAFLVDLSVGTTTAREYMEECTETISGIRKEVLEIKREVKRVEQARNEIDEREREEHADGEESPEEEEEEEEEVVEESGNEDDIDAVKRRADSESRHQVRQAKMKERQERRSLETARRAQQYAAEREAAREAANLARARGAERRKLDDEEFKLHRRLEQHSREERRYSTLRFKPLGRDRHHAKYFYFDAVGCLAAPSSGLVPYGTGRVFVQSPGPAEARMLEPYADRLGLRPLIGKATSGCDWGYYSEPEELEALMAWLNPKGVREWGLKRALEAQKTAIIAAMKKRNQEHSQTTSLKPEEPPRRSTRAKVVSAVTEPCFSYTNKLAK